MQNYKSLFGNSNHLPISTLQSCIRTNDLELIGDGTHLTYFEMLGNFSFDKNIKEYIDSVDMWHSILLDLKIKQECIVHVHPESHHHILWKHLGYEIINDNECTWSDGNIGGYCSEIYCRGIEIGNLVNTLGYCTDVGFGWERLLMILEGKNRVDETSLFDQSLSPIERDHTRTIQSMWNNKINPGNKGKNYICRKILRKIINIKNKNYDWWDWVEEEKKLKEKILIKVRKMWPKYKHQSKEWWRSTTGITEDDLSLFFENFP